MHLCRRLWVGESGFGSLQGGLQFLEAAVLHLSE
jgi:hypothetical protein